MVFFWDGKYEKALKEFKTVMEFYPRHPVAEKYILECNEKITAGETGKEGFPSWAIWVLIVIAGLIVIAVIIYALKRVPASKPKKGFGYLLGQAGPLTGNRFPVEKSGLRIGRDPSQCNIVLTEDVVSREHAVIEPAPDGKTIRIKSLSATNPTRVNDRAITEAELKDGDQIKIGQTVLVYKIE